MEGVDDKAELIRVKQQRAEIMTAMGKDKTAAELYREIYQISDSMNIKDTKRQLAEMNARFNVDELEMKQARLKMEQAPAATTWYYYHCFDYRYVVSYLYLLPASFCQTPENSAYRIGKDP